MFNSKNLPESPINRRLSDSTLDSYSDFRNYLLSPKKSFDNCDDDHETFPTNNEQESRQIPPLDLKLNKPFIRLPSDVQRIKKPNFAYFIKKTKKETEISNSDKGSMCCFPTNISTKGKSAKMQPAATIGNKENNLPDLSRGLDVTEKQNKRKLFDTEAPSKQGTKKSKTWMNFDEEMGHKLDGQPVIDLVSDSSSLSTEDYQDDRRCYRKLPKRKSVYQRNIAEVQQFQEDFSSLTTQNDNDSNDRLHDKDVEVYECASSLNESSITDESEDIEKIAISRYGRVRKAPPKYINAAIFGGNSQKSTKIQLKAATLMNSNNCKSRSSISIKDTSNFLNFFSPAHKRMDSSESSYQSTSSENGEIIFKKSLDNSKPKRSTCSSENGETFPKSPNVIILQNIVLRPANKQEKPVEHVKTLIDNSHVHHNTLLAIRSQPSISHATCQTSNKNFEDVFDDLARRPDPNKIYAVVNDEVDSFEWYAPTPGLDLVLSDENVHYSMSNLTSYYTNVTVGYLKIDAGKFMKVLRDCVMLYFVEQGEALFQVSEREIVGQIGSTFFIPLGMKCTIINLKMEDLILKFIKMSPTTPVL